MRTALALATALIGLTTLTSCTEEEEERFGTVRIEMAPLAGKLEIFNGTATVVATVHYESCLQDFYVNRFPTYQQDGPDGAPVFEEWAGRLCSDFADLPDCEVLSIEQNLLDVQNIYSLKVTYKINDPSSLSYREVHVGPLPLPSFAACGDSEPTVELQVSGLIGKDSADTQIWGIATLPGSNVAVPNQGAPLRVELNDLNNNP